MHDRKTIEELEDSSIDELNAELFNSIYYQYLDKVYLNILFHFGISLDIKDNFSFTPLHWAARSGYIEGVELLIKSGAFIDVKTHIYRTPLHRAAFYGHVEVIKALLAVGSSIESKDISGKSALHLAAYRGNVEAVKELLKAGASKDARTSRRETPWDLAKPDIKEQVPELDPNA